MDNACLSAVVQAQNYEEKRLRCQRLIVTDGMRMIHPAVGPESRRPAAGLLKYSATPPLRIWSGSSPHSTRGATSDCARWVSCVYDEGTPAGRGPAIARANRTQCGSDQSLAGCITNIFLRPNECDLVSSGSQVHRLRRTFLRSARPHRRAQKCL
jgi:hypothetical protein